jgi:hypothetical protein
LISNAFHVPISAENGPQPIHDLSIIVDKCLASIQSVFAGDEILVVQIEELDKLGKDGLIINDLSDSVVHDHVFCGGLRDDLKGYGDWRY